ncbi:aspartic peptidase domain-containing protein [Staphylotrichum tortipilum]|uniref:Aspartic peptidase domain-containing protein n=1 Tax=Staphylotrichum tortipilum TaxID=2831512 RepID=A0AAN6M9M7_9PEZI|nr:aspartic peptidase domain-containing protein [Staphylotrichum longicolle]
MSRTTRTRPASSMQADLPIQKRSFKVDRLRNPHFRRHHGPSELLRTYQKYRMPIPQGLLQLVQDDADKSTGQASPNSLAVAVDEKDATILVGDQPGSGAVGLVPATPANQGIEYVSPISIGGQRLMVALDSGSADFWVFGTGLPLLTALGHQRYNPSRSPTFREMPRANFSILYGDGTSASGNVGTDRVDVGGATVASQAVQMATSVSPAFAKDTHLSGMLGLGFSQLSTVQPVKQKTFFENVMPSLAQPLFTADLRRDTPGAFEFGRIDRSKFAGALSWVPTFTGRGFWEVSTAGFMVETRSTTMPAAQAVVDTGTTLMLVSREMVEGYYSHVFGAEELPGAGGMTFPCNASLPDLFLDVGGGYTARIRGEDINFGVVKGDICFGGIQRTTSVLQVWGDVFFRSQFVVFHGGNHSLGMAPHVY